MCGAWQGQIDTDLEPDTQTFCDYPDITIGSFYWLTTLPSFGGLIIAELILRSPKSRDSLKTVYLGLVAGHTIKEKFKVSHFLV